MAEPIPPMTVALYVGDPEHDPAARLLDDTIVAVALTASEENPLAPYMPAETVLHAPLFTRPTHAALRSPGGAPIVVWTLPDNVKPGQPVIIRGGPHQPVALLRLPD
jgi:hypothetical protein